MACPSGARITASAAPFLASLLLLFASTSHAEWNVSGETVPRVDCGPSVTACSDGSGGLLTFWLESRGGGNGLWAHRRMADGSTAAGWPDDGLRVASTSNFTASLGAVPDGSGGAFVLTCATFLNVPDKRLFLWRVGPDGTRDPAWPDSGLAIHGGGRNKAGSLIPDGAGGVFVSWVEFLGPELTAGGRLRATHELRITRVLGNGLLARGWTRPGKVLFTAPPGSLTSELRSLPILEADGDGGVFVAHADSSDGWNESRLYRLTPRGVLAAGWSAAGLAFGTPEREIQMTDLALDFANGVYACAREGSTFSTVSRLARLTATGSTAPGWPADGQVQFPGTADTRFPLGVVSDGSGGALLATLELTGTQLGYRFLDVDPGGTPASGWTETGLAVSDDLALDENRVFPDGEGGLCLVSTRFRPSVENQMVVRRVTPEGTFLTGWPEDGRVLIDWTGPGTTNAVAVDGRRAVYAVRTAIACPTLAYRVGDDPARAAPRPAAAAFISDLGVAPNPARGEARFTLKLTRSGPVSVDVVDLGGRVVRTLREDLHAGENVLRWDGDDGEGRPAPPGLYFVRARGGASLTTARLVRLR